MYCFCQLLGKLIFATAYLDQLIFFWFKINFPWLCLPRTEGQLKVVQPIEKLKKKKKKKRS